jgi:hypothetical protein
MLFQPSCHKTKYTEAAEEAVAYITNLLKISLPDGKGLVGM